MKKIPEKLQGYTEYKDIKRTMKEVVSEFKSVDQFQTNCGNFVAKFSLVDNQWLTCLYEERHRWVPIYFKGRFWAGLSTTQRIESMNAFFDGYINSMTTLQQFVQQYDNALQHKWEKEETDFPSLNTVIHCGSQSLIERQFQKEYTHAKFTEGQTEFRSKMNFLIHHFHSDGQNCTYTVMEESIHHEHIHERFFTVFCDKQTKDVRC